jgi:hypothetical protein
VKRSLPFLVIAGCIAAQIFLGPANGIAETNHQWVTGAEDRARKTAFVRQIAPEASVLAPLPYLAHLAMRERLFSLHYVLKGLKTLSRSGFEPPAPTDFVLIDYNDSATFDPVAGYYHPAMKTVDGRVIPSSDRLLHEFLKRTTWAVISINELTLLRQGQPQAAPAVDSNSASMEIDAHTTLTSIAKSSDTLSDQGIDLTMNWNFQEGREFIPWMFLKLTPPDHSGAIIISRGLSAPEIASGAHQEKWRITPSRRIPPGEYNAEAFFLDNSKLAWRNKAGAQKNTEPTLQAFRLNLGPLAVKASSN